MAVHAARKQRRIRSFMSVLALTVTAAVLLTLTLRFHGNTNCKKTLGCTSKDGIVADNGREIDEVNKELPAEISLSRMTENHQNAERSASEDTVTIPLCDRTSQVHKCDTIHISIVCAGHNASREVVTLIKSILFYRKNPLHFHFISDEIGQLILETLFRTWDVPGVKVSLYLAETNKNDVSWIPNSSGLFDLMKVIVSNILPHDVDKVIVLNTVVIFATDIAELWAIFLKLTGKKAIGLAERKLYDWNPEKSHKPPSSLGMEFDTGVMLLDLKTLRDLDWTHMWRSAIEKQLMEIPMSITDKDVINAVISKHPYLLHTLPCIWNVHLSENRSNELCYTGDSDPTDVKVIQWNLPKKLHVKNKHIQFFHSLFLTFLEGDGNLLRKGIFGCPEPVTNTISRGKLNEDDQCYDLRREASVSYRTHLYYLDYQYSPQSSGNDVTLVSQLSIDRLQMLEKVAKHWEGPISASLYLTEKEAQLFLNYALTSDILMSRKNIGYHVVYKNGNNHPENFLRNTALNQVNTPYIFLLDIDLLPMYGMYGYQRRSITVLNKNSTKKALVIPPFETEDYHLNFPKSKPDLLNMFDTGKVFTFQHKMFKMGHTPTNFAKWRQTKFPYKVQWKPQFEPYVVVRKDCPLFDTRFIGYGGDKTSHIMELHAQGYEFIVLPRAFVIHMPHSPSFDLRKFLSNKLYHLCHEKLEKEFREDMFKKYGFVHP